jgi:hypothetical protein
VRTAAAAFSVALALTLAACGGPPQQEVRLRHEAKRRLRYELEQHEEAPHPTVGLGGTLDVASTVQLACLSVERDGKAHYEVTVEHVKLAGPPEMGAAVNTHEPRPAEGDRVGASAVAQALLPRTGLVVVTPTGEVLGAQTDAEVRDHVTQWIRGKPVAVRRALFRLAGALDAGPLVARWFNAVGAALSPRPVAHGASWTALPPAVETPGGTLTTTLDLTFLREGAAALVDGKGAFALQGTPPADRLVDFVSGTVAVAVRVDLERGVLLSYEETGDLQFRMREDDAPLAPWRIRRRLRLIE